MKKKIIWWLIKFNFRLSVLMLLALVITGALTHTDFGMHWVVNTPYLTLTDPHTGDILHKIQPARVLAMTGYLFDDWLYGVIRYWIESKLPNLF